MVRRLETWAGRDPEGVYRELDHPADVFVEVAGKDFPTLLENALFAFYDRVAELEGFQPDREMAITVEGATPADALRALLAEALFRFETEGFVAVAAEVEVEPQAGRCGGAARSGEERDLPGEEGNLAAAADEPPLPGMVKIEARLYGERAVRGRHVLLAEIKAVTYHRLQVTRTPSGACSATVLFDV